MRSVFERADAHAALSAVAKVINHHSTVPILKTALLHANGDAKVTVRATDLQTSVERSFSAVVMEPGEVAVGAKALARYLQFVPDGPVTIEDGVRSASISFGSTTAQFNGEETEPSPPMPALGEQRLKVPGEPLLAAIRAVAFAASTEEQRGAALMQTHFKFGNGYLTLMATDGYRLAHYRTDIRCGELTAKLDVSSESIPHILENFDGCDEIELAFGGKFVDVLAPDRRCSSRLIDGVFPDTDKILSDAQATRCWSIVDRVELIAALRRAELFAGDRASMVTLKCADERLSITATGELQGSTTEILLVEQDGDEQQIALNSRYLTGILDAIDTERVVLAIQHRLSPAKIYPVRDNGENQTYLLMPLRS